MEMQYDRVLLRMTAPCVHLFAVTTCPFLAASAAAISPARLLGTALVLFMLLLLLLASPMTCLQFHGSCTYYAPHIPCYVSGVSSPNSEGPVRNDKAKEHTVRGSTAHSSILQGCGTHCGLIVIETQYEAR